MPRSLSSLTFFVRPTLDANERMDKPPIIRPPRSKPFKLLGWGAGTCGLLCLLFLYSTGFWDSPEEKLRDLLSSGEGLAPLPKSATNVAFYQWGPLFTGETYAKFEASPEDIRAFVEGSRELSIKPEDVFSADHKLLPMPSDERDIDRKHAYFRRRDRMPEWFSPSIHGSGRQYLIWPWHRIYIDEERHIVWLHFIKN